MSGQKGWRDLTPGTVMPGRSTSLDNPTGTWRGGRVARWFPERCIQCHLCWLYCPHFAILLDAEAKVAGINELYCVACGICAEVCPTRPKAIEMVPEELKLEDESPPGSAPPSPHPGGEASGTDEP